MAYRSSYINNFQTDRTTYLSNLYAELNGMGWTLFDTGAASTPIPDKSITSGNVDPVLDTFTSASHGLLNGNKVKYSVAGGIAPGGLTSNTLYFVVGVTTNTFQLASTQGGAVINLTNSGSGTHIIGEGFRVYSSNGESADCIVEYIYIHSLTADRVTFQAYYVWTVTTHTGTTTSISTTTITTSETGFVAWIYGDKNLVFLHTRVSSIYYCSGFGHIPTKFWTTLTNLTIDCNAGTAVVLNVTNATNFIVNKYYQILGATQEGRDRVLVTAKTSNTITISLLPRNYSTNSLIGQTPSTFGNFATDNFMTFYNTCNASIVGLANANSSASGFALIPETQTNPDQRAESLYVIGPTIYCETDNSFAYIDTKMLGSNSTGKLNEDTISVNSLDTGTSSGLNTVTTLNDLGKVWTINGYANKVLVIVGGTGTGQIRKISSNTATQLVVNYNFVTIPDATSQYSINDEAYRYFALGGNNVFQEGV